VWPQTLSLYLASHSDGPWLWAISVGVSDYCPGQHPSMLPPLSCLRGQLILSPHMHMPRHHLVSDICPPPKHLPHPPKTSYRRHNSLVCVYGRQISETVIFGGPVYGDGANAQHALHINAVTILLVYNFFFHTVRNGICRVTNLLLYLQNTVTVEKRVVKHSLKSL